MTKPTNTSSKTTAKTAQVKSPKSANPRGPAAAEAQRKGTKPATTSAERPSTERISKQKTQKPRAPKSRAPAAIVPPQSVAGRALTLVVAIMAFLACITVGAVTIVRDAAHDWQNDLVREVTVQIRPVDGIDMVREIDKTIALVQEFPGVGAVRALSDEETKALLEPWLGEGLQLETLPVPRIVTVQLNAPDQVDFVELRRAIQEQVHGGSIDDHSVWTARLASMAGAVVYGGFAILILVMTAMVLSVVFATRSAMAGNREVVEVLHLVGAEHDFIAREFQRHFLMLGLKGGMIGGGAAILGFFVLDLLSGSETRLSGTDQLTAMFGGFSVGLSGYFWALGIVFLVAVLTAATSRLAVHTHLQQMS